MYNPSYDSTPYDDLSYDDPSYDSYPSAPSSTAEILLQIQSQLNEQNQKIESLKTKLDDVNEELTGAKQEINELHHTLQTKEKKSSLTDTATRRTMSLLNHFSLINLAPQNTKIPGDQGEESTKISKPT